MTTDTKPGEKPLDDVKGWWIEQRNGRWQVHAAHRGPGSNICLAEINQWADDAEATARKMAASPDMFEAMSEKDGILIQNVLAHASGVARRAGEAELADRLWRIMEWQCAALARANREIAVAQEVEPKATGGKP